jgi:hypothetical protein
MRHWLSLHNASLALDLPPTSFTYLFGSRTKTRKRGALAYMDLGDKMKLDTDMNKLDELLIEYTKRKFSIELSHYP